MAHLLFPGVDSSIRYHHIESPKPSEDPLQNPWFPPFEPIQSTSITENTRIESGRDPRHITEDSIEENGEERIAHFEYYEGAEEFPIKVPPEQTAALIYQSTTTTTNPNMAVLPGRCVRSILDFFALIISIVLIVIQFGLLDWYYLNVTGDNVWAAWIGPDLVVVLVIFVLGVIAIKYNRVQMEECCSIDSRVKYACIAWGVYSVILISKVATCFRLFYEDIPPTPLDNNDKLFDDFLFKTGLSLSVLIFLFIFESHHYTPLVSVRQVYISYLVAAICLDLIDNVYFLDLLWQASKDKWNLELWLELTILAVACINFFMPTFALAKLRYAKVPRFLLVSEKLWAFLYVLLVNGPFLGLRIYLYIVLEVQQHGKKYDASLFAVKNIAMIYIALRELWTRLQYWRMKRRAALSRNELAAAIHHQEEEQ
ncbi:hypothetical protein CAEBREN_10024 [Caenorhabditis brenneri]|uniref:Transmembrane protein n=1 Tax=Caenorhabditis brenneri TaxID=135651 RepID=G0NG01_CAEBE|nr:hypothetical protein CAEBREN_10024 [Caenorhabditis brenneri]